ncbi:hypothetical protein [Bacillus sp. FJAT-45350]|uniref:hypothetical protein n=1 Tax=Bacillus sp. FJAT-45350 TaxID=2011014 RepID=UPI000BB804D2|nr:hypothetical protein [Bacillus sp. FJAT-45350]
MTNFYENPTLDKFLRLVNKEIQMIERAEVLALQGELNRRQIVLEAKKKIKIKRICMKAALRQKEKAASADTLTATAIAN